MFLVLLPSLSLSSCFVRKLSGYHFHRLFTGSINVDSVDEVSLVREVLKDFLSRMKLLMSFVAWSVAQLNNLPEHLIRYR